ncbi:MAG: hypothetical protein K8T26_16125 [Lentisphaerae bacterium]|nr:hypothetical protein [Lentisphaerota bacterium]
MAAAQADTRWVGLTSDAPAPPAVRVVSDGPGETLVRVTVPGYVVSRDGPDGSPLWSLPGWSWTWEQGRPQVPRLAVDLMVAGEGNVTCEVLEQDAQTVSVTHYRLAVVTRHGQPPESIPQERTPRALISGLYPPAVAGCGEPFVLRRVRGVSLAIHPFQHDVQAERMRVTTNLLIRVRTVGTGGRNALAASGAWEQDGAFADTYRHQFVNARERAVTYDHVPDTGSMLVVAYDAFYDATLPYVYWKRQKGIPTEIVPVSSIGPTASNLQSFIQAYYASNGVTYVQLVGDADQVRSLAGVKGIMSREFTPADPLYVLLAGDDYYADAFIGRFPGRTVAEISNMVQRSIQYELAASTNGTWHHEACGVASSLLAGGSHDYDRMELIRAALTNSTYTLVDQIYDPSATLPQLLAALNAGRGLVNYQGDGIITAWLTPAARLTTADLLALTNTARLPFVYIVGCQNGAFHYASDCHAEAWLKGGTVAAPRGGVAVSASTHLQWALPPTTAQAEFVDLLVGQTFRTLGALGFNAMMKAVSIHTDANPDPPGTTGEELYEQSHLFGDVTLMPWTDTPRPLTVTHTGHLKQAQRAYAVHVPGVAGALCALYDPATHVLLGTAATDGDGDALVPVDHRAGTPLTLTVTAFNHVPYVAPVLVDVGLVLRVR